MHAPCWASLEQASVQLVVLARWLMTRLTWPGAAVDHRWTTSVYGYEPEPEHEPEPGLELGLELELEPAPVMSTLRERFQLQPLAALILIGLVLWKQLREQTTLWVWRQALCEVAS